MQQGFPDQAFDATTHPIRGQTDNTLANLSQRVPVAGLQHRKLEANQLGGRLLVQRAGSEPDQTFQSRIAVPGLVYLGEGTFHRLRSLN